MKIVEVVFDIPVCKKFEYAVDGEIYPFVRVLVPFGKTKRVGFVVNVKEGKDNYENLKSVIKIYDKNPLINSHLFSLSEFISERFVSSIGQAVFSIIGTLPLKMPSFKIKEISEKKEMSEKKVVVFKKEKEKEKFYLKIIKEKLKDGSVLFLTPEIEIAKNYFNLFKEEIDDIFLYYGEMKKKEKGEKWSKIAECEKKLIIGTRIGIFLPAPDISAIIVEDATNQAYQEKQTPKYETEEIVKFISDKTGATLFLCENCLSLRHYLEIEKGNFNKIVIGERKEEKKIYILKLRRKLMDKTITFLTKEAVSLMEETILRDKKVAIIHNRKGKGKILICEKCNYKFICKNCSSLLTLSEDRKKLFCKYCKNYFDFDKKCPECGSKKIIFKVYGIEKMMNLLEETYKNLKIVKYTGEIKNVEDDFNIVVGTSVIEEIIGRYKWGLIIFANADFYLNLNDFAAEEKFFIMVNNLLSKIENSVEIIIQTGSPELEIFKSLKELKEEIFYRKELKIRKQIGYPPFSRILKIEIKGSKKSPLERRKKEVEQILKENNMEIIYSGQSFPPAVGKKQIWKFLVKIKDGIPDKLKEIIDGKFITAEVNPSRI